MRYTRAAARGTGRLTRAAMVLAAAVLGGAACAELESPVEVMGPEVTPQLGKKPGTPVEVLPTGRLYYTNDEDAPGNLDIYAVNWDGSGRVRLTSAAGDDQLPRAARTRQRVAFLSDRQGTRSIYTMNGDGSDQRAVFTPDQGSLENLAISSDGSLIAFTATVAGQTDLWLINYDGTGLRRLTNDAVVEMTPAFAPTGRAVAYSATVNGSSDIYELTVNSGKVRKLTSGVGSKASPSYTPDGRTIIFEWGRDGNYDLYSMRSDGSRIEAIRTSTWHEVSPSVSPDGKFVAYLSFLPSGAGLGLRFVMIGNSNQTGLVTGSNLTSFSWGL